MSEGERERRGGLIARLSPPARPRQTHGGRVGLARGARRDGCLAGLPIGRSGGAHADWLGPSKFCNRRAGAPSGINPPRAREHEPGAGHAARPHALRPPLHLRGGAADGGPVEHDIHPRVEGRRPVSPRRARERAPPTPVRPVSYAAAAAPEHVGAGRARVLPGELRVLPRCGATDGLSWHHRPLAAIAPDQHVPALQVIRVQHRAQRATSAIRPRAVRQPEHNFGADEVGGVDSGHVRQLDHRHAWWAN